MCFLALLLVTYRPVLFQGGQFAYRDAAILFYPLYLRVQQEWDAGRWPLWDPGQNGGIPLLGNPITAVLYPGKVLYAWLPYAWGARLYIIAHTIVAFLGMLTLGRSSGLSWAGSYLAGLSYAFGAPVLFQYCFANVMVGAAWIPWGLCAIDRLLRQERRRGGAELAVVLALQLLGGDPEAAYLTAVCGVAYALILALGDSRDRPAGRMRFTLGSRPRGPGAAAPPLAPPSQGGERERGGAASFPRLSKGQFEPGAGGAAPGQRAPAFAPLTKGGFGGVWRARASHARTALRAWITVLTALSLWVVVTLGLACAGPAPARYPTTSWLVLAAWVAVGLGMAWHWHRRPGEARLAPALARLMGACALAMALAAVQILPTLEFAAQSRRAAADRAINVYRFSLAPVRVVELAWPNVFGISSPENRSWLQGVPPVGDHEVWVDSLYMGGLVLVLTLSVAGWRGGPPWRAWLTTVAVVSLAASFGKYGGPLWWARWGPGAATLGPHDPAFGQPRWDHFPHDGALSPYGILATLLPGFGAFHHPSKLLTFTAAALAALAGAGWDRLTAGDTVRLRRLGRVGLGASLLGLALAAAARGPAVADLATRVPPDTLFGPADGAGAWAETERALAHGAIVFAAVLALAHWAPRHPRAAAALALLLLAADLAVANARLIWTVPQADFETPSEAARRIEAAERADPAPGPFRIHRMLGWYPVPFSTTGSVERFREWVSWERGTLQPLYGLPLGLDYCATVGALELADHAVFFRPRARPVPAGRAPNLGVPAGQPVVYFPRRSFDLWGARYFLLPARPEWQSLMRGFASFLDQTELIYPSPDVLDETQSRGGHEPWVVRQDWQLRRNRAAYPRAWIVHHARIREPAADPQARAGLIRTLTFMNDPIWREGGRTVLDLRQMAVIETDEAERLKGFLSPTPVGPAESVAVVAHQPQRVELRARLERPGLVILADAYYPGWQLSIDGRPAGILRANRLMRGAAVPAGEHALVYTYRPDSFRIGALVSAAGGVVWVALAWSGWRSSRDQASNTH
jgi:hypothetical protein